VRALQRAAHQLLGVERARLRIGAFSSSLAGIVPELVERLRRASPDVQVLVHEATVRRWRARYSRASCT
jgi:DNA-binding transcriptional LysR family regulator